MTFGTEEQTRRLVEVTALQALSEIYMDRNILPKIAECENKLRGFAFPEEINLCNHTLHMFHMDKCPNCSKEF